jgi:hypothetical protein
MQTARLSHKPFICFQNKESSPETSLKQSVKTWNRLILLGIGPSGEGALVNLAMNVQFT